MAKSNKPKVAKAKSAVDTPPPAPDTDKAQEEAAAREEEHLKLVDQDEEDETEQNLRERASAPGLVPSAPGTLDKSIVVLEYIGPKRAPFPVMFGDDITWFGRNIYDGLDPWQGRVERWYADAIMSQEPGWWKVVKKTPPPPKTLAAKKTQFDSTAWISVRTLEDVELFAKRIDPATPPARISYLRKLVTSFRMVQTDETADAIDAYVEMFPPIQATPEDAPRRGTRRVDDDSDADELVNSGPTPADVKDADADADEEEFK